MSAVIQLHPHPIIPVILVKVDPMLLSPCVPSDDFLRNTFFPCFFFIFYFLHVRRNITIFKVPEEKKYLVCTTVVSSVVCLCSYAALKSLSI